MKQPLFLPIFTFLFCVAFNCAAQTPIKTQVGYTQAEDVNIGFQCPGGKENELRPKIKLSVGDVTKKAKELPQPERSSKAKAAGTSGKAVTEVAIDLHTGEIVWARIVSGHPLLREAVKKVVCQARFYPSLINSPPIRVGGTITYKFRKS